MTAWRIPSPTPAARLAAPSRTALDYHFVSDSTFREMIGQNAFLEWANVHGHLYGTAFDALKAQMSAGSDVIMDVDVQGGRNVKKQFPDSALIFLLPPSLEVLRKRLTARGTDDPEVIEKRMAQASEEIKQLVRGTIISLLTMTWKKLFLKPNPLLFQPDVEGRAGWTG